MPQYILAIDLGTSGPKVALSTLDGTIAGWAFEPVPLHLLPGGGAEQNPADWWAAIVAAARRAMARCGAAPGQVVAVSCTAQWSGTVAVDRAHQPLARAIIWMDTRGAPYLHRVIAGFPGVQGYGARKLLAWLRLTGGAPGLAGKDSLAHILYLKYARPEIYHAAATFLEPKDYLNLCLTGQCAASFDSIVLHWVTDNRDIANVRYHADLLAITGIARAKLPELRRAVDPLGPLTPRAAGELGLVAGIPVITGSPDIQSAAIGAGTVADYAANLYLGTSAWLTCHVPYKKTDLAHNMASLPAAIPGRYLLTNEQELAGGCLRFLRDALLFADDELGQGPPPDGLYATMDRMAAQVPAGSGGVIFTPWLIGERTPVENHTLRGGFHNLSLGTTRAQLIRAVLEGVACNTRWMLGAVEAFIGRRLDGVTMIGGGAHSAPWCQIMADMLDRPVRQAADPLLANVRGAATLAAVALGHTTFERAAARVPVAQTFQPDPAHRRTYDQLFATFLRIYQANRGIYARLNRHG